MTDQEVRDARTWFELAAKAPILGGTAEDVRTEMGKLSKMGLALVAEVERVRAQRALQLPLDEANAAVSSLMQENARLRAALEQIAGDHEHVWTTSDPQEVWYCAVEGWPLFESGTLAHETAEAMQRAAYEALGREWKGESEARRPL